MTNRFVPDKPGWYHHVDGIAEVYLTESRSLYGKGQLRVWRGGQGFDEGDPVSVIHEWIAPVTPPDVVADLVAALEAVLGQDVDRYDKAHAALARFRKGE